ncbi:MAG: hypothetical protein V1709_08630 [Planctomycetota bacterium]
MLTIEFDDFSLNCNRLDLFAELKKINPAFKVTVYAIPALCPEAFLKSVPDYIELAVHGWAHSPAHECKLWIKEDMLNLLDKPIIKLFVKGFKAPWYAISNGCYEGLKERGYWVSDVQINKIRWPDGMKVYVNETDKNCWYGHLGEHNKDGLKVNFSKLVERIKDEKEFKFVSERV